MTQKKSRLEVSGAPSEAQKALYEENARIDSGQSPTSPDKFVDVLIEFQKQMTRTQEQNTAIQSALLQRIDDQAAALKQHMAETTVRTMEMNERQAREMQAIMSRLESIPEGKKAQTQARVANDMVRKNQVAAAKIQNDSMVVRQKLNAETKVPWYFTEPMTLRTSGVVWGRVEKGMSMIPESIAIRLAEGMTNRQILEQFQGVMSADADQELPRFGENPNAAEAVLNQIVRRNKEQNREAPVSQGLTFKE